MFSLGNCLLFLSRFRDSFKLLKLIELAAPLDHLHGRLRYWHFHWIMFWYEISYVLCALTHNRPTAHTHTQFSWGLKWAWPRINQVKIPFGLASIYRQFSSKYCFLCSLHLQLSACPLPDPFSCGFSAPWQQPRKHDPNIWVWFISCFMCRGKSCWCLSATVWGMLNSLRYLIRRMESMFMKCKGLWG